MFQGKDGIKDKDFLETNKDNSFFVFSFADLELCRRYHENGHERRKCRIISDKLSAELRKIYSQEKNDYIPPIKFIDFVWGKEERFDLIYFNFKNWCDAHVHYIWIMFYKKILMEEAKVTHNGTLFVYSEIKDISKLLWKKCDFKSLKFVFFEIPHFVSFDSSPQDFCEKKTKETIQARDSALLQIQSLLSHIDTEELGSEYLNEFRPSECLYYGELSPQEEEKYYRKHIKECLWRPDRINEFKDNLIAFIQQKITEFDAYKNSIIQQIIQKANNHGVSEAELNADCPDWQKTLRSLKDRKEVIIQDNSITTAIIRREKESKKKKRSAAEIKLARKRNSASFEIISYLLKGPILTKNDLSPKYQNWEKEINQLTDIQQITNLKNEILADIQTHRQNIRYQKKETTPQRLQNHGENIKKRLAKKLEDNQIKETELTNENQQIWKKIKNREVKDFNQLTTSEKKIEQNICQIKVKKKLVYLASQVDQILKSPNPSQINVLQKELLAFINTNDIYHSSQRATTENLLTKLKNFSINNEQNNSETKPENFPGKIVFFFSLLIGILLLMVLAIRAKKFKKKS